MYWSHTVSGVTYEHFVNPCELYPGRWACNPNNIGITFGVMNEHQGIETVCSYNL